MLGLRIINQFLDLHDAFMKDRPENLWALCKALRALDQQRTWLKDYCHIMSRTHFTDATKKWLKEQDDTIRNRLERIRDGPHGWVSSEEPQKNEDELGA